MRPGVQGTDGRRGDQGPRPTPQGRGRSGRHDARGGAQSDEGPLEEPDRRDGLVPEDQEGLRGATGELIGGPPRPRPSACPRWLFDEHAQPGRRRLTVANWAFGTDGGVRVRKIVAYQLLSLDGVAEAPDTFFTEWDDAMEVNLARVIATQDAVLLGRRSYGEWARYWPDSEIEPFASFINGVTKHVA